MKRWYRSPQYLSYVVYRTAQRLGLLALAVLLAGLGLGPAPAAFAQGPPGAPPGAGKAAHLGAPAPGRPATIRAGNWTNLYPHLNEIAAISDTEAWAVGDYGHMVHIVNGETYVTDDPTTAGYLLSDIAMLSATDGWIAGGPAVFRLDLNNGLTAHSAGLSTDLTVTRLAPLADNYIWAIGVKNTHSYSAYQFVPAILHYDGTAWTEVPASLQNTDTLEDITMSGPNEGWAVGWTDVNGEAPLLLRYDGTRWTRTNNLPPTGGKLGHLRRAQAVAPGEVWITGLDNSYRGTMFHYSAGTWTNWYTVDNSKPFSLAIHSATDIWVAGRLGDSDSLLHWDGNSWMAEASPRRITGLAAAADGQFWAAGYADTVLRSTGGYIWTVLRSGPTDQTLNGVSALTPDDVWAVGDRGTTIHIHAGTTDVVQTPTRLALQAVQMISPTLGYAVGGSGGSEEQGTIIHWDGAQWTQVITTPTRLNALVLLNATEGWAVGDAGYIWHLSSGVWARFADPFYVSTLVNLTGLALDSPAHGWAIGQGAVIEYDGTHWMDRREALPRTAAAASSIALAPGGQEGWAVGYIPDSNRQPLQAISHLRDGAWTTDTTNAAKLTTVAIEAAGEAWVLGCDEAYHYVAGVWQRAGIPTNGCVRSLALVPGRGGWTVGDFGTLIRYTPLAAEQRFYDVPLANPFALYVEYMVAHNIISGYGDNTFHPSANVTRGQVAKMVVNAEGWTLRTPATPTFADVPPTHPFYGYIETAAAHSAISGYGDRTFHPQADVTRGQLTKILVRAQGWTPLTPVTPTFADVPADHPFYGYVERAYARGLINGYGSVFHPAAAATRAQLSKVLYLVLVPPR